MILGAKKSRRRFLADLLFLGTGILAASLLLVNRSKWSSQAMAESDEDIDFDAFTQISKQEDISSNASTFVGQTVEDYEQKVAARNNLAYRFRSTYDEDSLLPRLKHFLGTPQANSARALVIGDWHGDDPELSSAEIITDLVASKSLLPELKAIYLGDIISEENEMSWIVQSDVSPLLEAFPKLQVLRVRGGNGLSIRRPSHGELRALALETGGLDRSVVESISKANFPNLEYLELWLGTEDYGATVGPEDLAAILSGSLFPKLRYLGLRNSHIADQLAKVLLDCSLLARLEVLDLSLGTLGDEGGEALLKLKAAKLKKLDLHHHYMTDSMVSKLQSLPFEVNSSISAHMYRDEEPYVAVGE